MTGRTLLTAVLMALLVALTACSGNPEEEPLRLEFSLPESASPGEEVQATLTVTNTTDEQINYVITLGRVSAVGGSSDTEDEWSLTLFSGTDAVWPVMLAANEAHTHQDTWNVDVGSSTGTLPPGEYDIVTAISAHLPGKDESERIESEPVRVVIR